MHRLASKVGFSVLVLGGCAHAPEARPAGTELEQLSRTARLEGDLLRYEARVTELEARMALLEQEARGGRSTARPSETVRIGADRGQHARGDAQLTGDDAEAYAGASRGEEIPMLRLHGGPRRVRRGSAGKAAGAQEAVLGRQSQLLGLDHRPAGRAAPLE